MLIIPEIETVVLQPPRTGTTSVRDAVLATYPRAFALYRHMEFAGIPSGYDRWRTVCQVRDPLDRLLSVYRYMYKPKMKKRTDSEWVKAVTQETRQGFTKWLLFGMFPFANPGSPVLASFRPYYNVAFSLPEQRKSQSLYTGKGTELLRFSQLRAGAMAKLGVSIEVSNESEPKAVEYDPRDIEDHMLRYHGWDIAQLSNAAVCK